MDVPYLIFNSDETSSLTNLNSSLFWYSEGTITGIKTNTIIFESPEF